MPTFKELEHEGNEFFAVESNRETVKRAEIKITENLEKKQEEERKKLQEEWLSTNNPFLWTDLD